MGDQTTGPFEARPQQRGLHYARRYGVIVLVVEVMGGLAMLPYGLCLTMRVTNGAPPAPDEKGQVGESVAGQGTRCA